MLTASSLGYIFPGGVSLLRVGQSRFDRGNEFIQPVKRSSRCFRRSSLTFRPLDAFLTFFKTSMITKTLGKKNLWTGPRGRARALLSHSFDLPTALASAGNQRAGNSEREGRPWPRSVRGRGNEPRRKRETLDRRRAPTKPGGVPPEGDEPTGHEDESQ